MNEPPSKIVAPWDAKTVLLLNIRQQLPWWHEYTCNAGCVLQPGTLGGLPFENLRVHLIATSDGWVCPGCQYRQDWAYQFDLVIAADAIVRKYSYNHF